jgi:hypothetical protein
MKITFNAKIVVDSPGHDEYRGDTKYSCTLTYDEVKKLISRGSYECEMIEYKCNEPTFIFKLK